MVNLRLTEIGILKSEPETKKGSHLIEKQKCDRETQNLRFRDPLVGCARFRDLGRICQDFSFLEDHSPPLHGSVQHQVQMQTDIKFDCDTSK